eukprot:g2775.t1
MISSEIRRAASNAAIRRKSENSMIEDENSHDDEDGLVEFAPLSARDPADERGASYGGPMELAHELVSEPLVFERGMTRRQRILAIEEAFDVIDQILEKEAYESGKKAYQDPGFDSAGKAIFKVWKADKFGFRKERKIELDMHEATMSVKKGDALHKVHKITMVKCAEPLSPTSCKVVFGPPADATLEEMEEAKEQRPYDLTFDNPSEIDRFIVALAVTQDVGRRREARGKDARKSTIGRRVSLSETDLNCVRLTFMTVKTNKWGTKQERLIDIKPDTSVFTVSELSGEVKKVFKLGEVMKCDKDPSDDRKLQVTFQAPTNLLLSQQLQWEVNRPYELCFLNERSRDDFVHSMALARAKWRSEMADGNSGLREKQLRKLQLRCWYVGLLHPTGAIVACELLWQKGSSNDDEEGSLFIQEDTIRLRNADATTCGFEYGSSTDDLDSQRIKINTKFPAYRMGRISFGHFSLGNTTGESVKVHLTGSSRETILSFVFEDSDHADTFITHAKHARGRELETEERPEGYSAASSNEVGLNALSQAVENLRRDREAEAVAKKWGKKR